MLRFRVCESFPSWRKNSVPTKISVSCNASRKLSSLPRCQDSFVPGSGREARQPIVQSVWQSSNKLASAFECLPLGMAAHGFLRLVGVSLSPAGKQALCSCNASNDFLVSILLAGSEKTLNRFCNQQQSFYPTTESE